MNRFLSFADSRMSAALERLGRQAEALDFFDEITLFTEHDLSAEFTSRMGRYLTPSCRGFGYWSWKPWSIHHVLQEMEEGDRLLYLDAGCHINANGTDRFREYVNMLDRDSRGMLVFTNGQPEYKWTKGDIFRHFGVSQEDGHITHTQQRSGIGSMSFTTICILRTTLLPPPPTCRVLWKTGMTRASFPSYAN